MSDSLQPYGEYQAGPPCPSPTPGAYSNSCSSCHPAISASVVRFSSCLQSFPATGSLPMSLFFASGGQSITGSASISVPPMNIQHWFPLELTGWISLQSKGLSRVFSQHHSSKASIFRHSAFFTVQHSQAYMTTGKTIVLTRRTFVGKVVSAFQYTSYFGHNFSSKEQATFNFLAAVTICSDFGAQEN